MNKVKKKMFISHIFYNKLFTNKIINSIFLIAFNIKYNYLK